FGPGLLLLAEGAADPDAAFLDYPLAFWGYLWLILACLYFLIRCLADLALVRRPALAPNLDFAGLAWLGGALFVSLIAAPPPPPPARRSPRRTSATPPTPPPRSAASARRPSSPTPRPASHPRASACGWSAAWPFCATSAWWSGWC